MIKQITFFAILIIVTVSGIAASNLSFTKENTMITYPAYDELWEKVQTLDKDGKPKSAKEVVEQIYIQAKTDNNPPQIYKSLLYQARYISLLEEDSELIIDKMLREEINLSEAPAKQLLQSALAELYWHYFQQNSYQFINRTSTNQAIEEEDFRTWDLSRIMNATEELYLASLEAKELKQLSTKDFVSIIEQNNTENTAIDPLFSNLYNVLLKRSIDFFSHEHSSLAKPQDQYELKEKKALGTIEEFLSFTPKGKPEDHKIIALSLYQELLSASRTSSKHSLLLANLLRINYVNQTLRSNDKEKLYEQALLHVLNHPKNQNEEVLAVYGFQLASLYSQQGSSFSIENKTYQWKKKEAVDFCKQMIKRFPESQGEILCNNLLAELTMPSLSLEIETYATPNEPLLMKINHKNINSIEYKIAPITKKQENKLNSLYYLEKDEFILQLVEKAIIHHEDSLQNIGDYQMHNSELVIDALPANRYILVGYSKDSNELTHVPYNIFYTSSISYFCQDNRNRLYVADRVSGKPIPKANVTLSHYNEKSFSKTTNTDGYINMPNNKDHWYSYSLSIAYKKEVVDFPSIYPRSYNQEQSTTTVASIFTDRSIYRPGQTVYFKAIAHQSDGINTSVVPNQLVTVSFIDANYELIEKLSLKTNEFGSVHGNFVIPQGKMLGRYSLSISDHSSSILYSSESISVEEYKRPKFEVEIQPLQGNYKLESNISVEGKAIAFAGSSISNATVSYRVVRKVSYPFWCWWYGPMPQGVDAEIADGSTTTNSKGEFAVEFAAVPDVSTSSKSLPVFEYEIQVDVTDINGETQSDKQSVFIGSVAMNIGLFLPSVIDKQIKPELKLTSTNLNNQPVKAEGTIEIFSLQSPAKVYGKRPWEAPEYAIDKKTFTQLFPHIPYEESSIGDYQIKEQVYSSPITIDGEYSLNLPVKKWEQGHYRIIVETKDAFGKLVKQEQLFYIQDSKAKKVATHQLFEYSKNKTVYNPSDEAILTIGTAAEELPVLIQVFRDHTIIVEEWKTLSNEKYSITIPITEQDRGGLSVSYTYVKWNSFYTEQDQIDVPWTNKELSFEVETFRDKLSPGKEETWTFTLSGEEAEHVNAELLANMYDASLDTFITHDWNQRVYRRNTRPVFVYSKGFSTTTMSIPYSSYRSHSQLFSGETTLNLFGATFSNQRHYFSRRYELDEAVVAEEKSNDNMLRSQVAGLSVVNGSGQPGASTTVKQKELSDNSKSKQDLSTVPIRKNLDELAFFYPQLKTDKKGRIQFSFTTPESLTKWKVMLFGHTQDMSTGYYQTSTVTQKELMVLPNAPRYIREGDHFTFASKIANMSKKPLEGEAELQLFDALSMKRIDDLFEIKSRKSFVVDAQENTVVEWTLNVPDEFSAVMYRIIAKANQFSDGEENTLPVLTNRMLVTETMPIWLRGNETKNFSLEKLVNTSSDTRKNHQLTLEMTSNPAWLAVQSMPYLMEFPYECNEQLFSRYYANSLSTHLANSNPSIKRVFDIWRTQEPDALQSNLEKNEELKSLLLRETPWVRDAQNETEQKRRIALLFDINNMANEQQQALNKLSTNQMSSGAWSWFPGGDANQFITQHIVAGLGHLDALGVKEVREHNQTWQMINKAIDFLDHEMYKHYNYILEINRDKSTYKTDYYNIHYLYARSYFTDIPLSKKHQEAFDFFYNNLKENWISNNLYQDGLHALTFHRYGDKEIALKLVQSLQERSLQNEEHGMYWKENQASWYWYQAPIETQALMIEVFHEITNDQKAVDELKVWLLKHKQTNQWSTTKATTEAIYALLLRGDDWLAINDIVEVSLGKKPIDIADHDVKTEAGTGYYKISWNDEEITPEMGNVSATKTNNGIAFGGLYWQYFEDLDKITSAETPLSINKEVFLKKNTSTGPTLFNLSDQDLHVGDLLHVRIELRVDRDMEFVHMKDMRAAGFEPINVLSQYKWQDGLGYYESTKDASTDFFFDVLPKGVYVFEYPLRVNQKGNFSNGITTIQCMYAPEFSSHSNGIRISVEE